LLLTVAILTTSASLDELCYEKSIGYTTKANCSATSSWKSKLSAAAMNAIEGFPPI